MVLDLPQNPSDIPATKAIVERQPRGKRTEDQSFFEVIYDPEDTKTFEYATWDFSIKKVFDHAVFNDVAFNDHWRNMDKVVIFAVHFTKCDFEGDFTLLTPSFKNCEFQQCDFGLSFWKRARFKDCKFYRCSFTVASFELCEFRNCKFSDISLSGNETILTGTVFTDPKRFINSAATNLDQALLSRKKVPLDYQKMRLEGTKASLARVIMASHLTHGSEEDYYKIVEVYQTVSTNAKILQLEYDLSLNPGLYKSLIAMIELSTAHIEKRIINTAGMLNKWGASVARPAIIGMLIITLFTLIYWMAGIKPNFIKSLVASCDVTLLIGYTKHASATDKSSYQILYVINMLTGLIWYSIFIPTIIGRISRVR